MNKDSLAYLSEVNSLVDFLKKQHTSAGGVKLAASRQDDSEVEALKHGHTQHLETKIHELQTQVEQKEAALVERDAKCQEQAAIIEALVQQMSEMEDAFSISRHQKVNQLADEQNNRLIKRIAYLESQLADAQQETQRLKILLKERKDVHGQHRRNDKEGQINNISTESSRNHASFPNRSSAKELSVALLLAESEKEDLMKQIHILQNSLNGTKHVKKALKRQYDE